MPLGGLISGTGQTFSSLLGSRKPPRADANRFAAPIQAAGGALAARTLKDIRPAIANAFAAYSAYQPKQEALAGQQEGVLNTLLGRRMAADPQESLRNIFQTAFAQIDPNVVAPLARFDVNSNMLSQRARGIDSGAIDSTAERLRNSRIASGRYYDVARNVYNVVPQLYNSAYAQDMGNEASARSFIPQISAGYEAVANRPTQGILNRIGTVAQAQGIEGQGIQNALSATQSYTQPTNFWDRLGEAGQKFGNQLSQDEDKMMAMVSSAMSGMGSAEGGAKAGGGGPAFGSTYPGAGGMYASIPNAQGGGYSAPIQ